MLSGVLKQVVERDPGMRFNLVWRTKYVSMLREHPAIGAVGFPPPGASMKRMDYWSMETLGSGDRRPYQILAREFGLPTPIDERLYLPGEPDADPILADLPWREHNIVIAPASDSPRKEMRSERWERLVLQLPPERVLVIQVGRLSDRHIRGAYSMLGLTTPWQLLGLLERCDLVITSDSFVMHCAHLLEMPAVVLWGPTHHRVYGYPEHIHIQNPRACAGTQLEACIGSGANRSGEIYGTQCPYEDRHCVDQTDLSRLRQLLDELIDH